MAKNKHFEDTGTLYLPVISGVKSGDPVIVGMIPGVAVTDRDSNNSATIDFGGVFDVSVTGAIASVGLPVYITSATGALVVAPGTGIQLFGHALATKSSGAGVIPVRIAQFAVASDAPA